MSQKTNQLGFGACALATLLASGAQAQVATNSSSYNSPYGMTQAQENTTVDPSLRDANGNLTVVNGVFTSSSMSQQTGVQFSSGVGASALNASLGNAANNALSTGAGVGGATTVGAATAIGNSLNVVTVGNDNTVIVNSTQTNNGNQTATVNVNGH
jgi:holdfast attachment protein HfaA